MRTFINGDNGLNVIQDWAPRCWINIENPTLEDLNYLTEELQIPQSFLNDIEDPDERPRIEHEDDWKIIVMRIPVRDTAHHGLPFSTVPLGIILRGDVLVTLCYHQNEMLSDFITYNQRKNRGFTNAYNLVLRLLLSSSVWYLKYLKQLNIQVKRAEKRLERAVRNQELQALLHIEKCYVFFITSINGNYMLLQRLKNNKVERVTFDEDLLEDVEIELKQAQESTNIHSNILSGMMDTYASVISNNMNNIMKQLTSVSIVLMVPTLIASFYGMNVPNTFQETPWAFITIVVVSLLISLGCFWVLRRRNWF
ncbi:MAG: magnesium transporter CorA family protein [Flavobacteriales bacterium]|jgi:magnesium transporter|nr:magnesium transporter CorA family protein [Flavobacteriales bacterium]MBQ1969535.1 magnesium transporter CorA family protein [Flavobacteriales bacterium]MBQ5815108.1 magnesium transporter CorA family protein [Flavobacteriales bacterium]